jgi:hypothetical protein
MRNVYKILVRKPEVKRPLGRYRHRWEDNIKMDCKERDCEDVDWMQLAQDKGSCEHTNGPLHSIKGRKFLGQLAVSFSRRGVCYFFGSV